MVILQRNLTKHLKNASLTVCIPDLMCGVQFPKGFETAHLPSGKGYIRTTPQPDFP